MEFQTFYEIVSITEYFGKHQSRVHRNRPFVVADFDDHSAADAHRFGQLPWVTASGSINFSMSSSPTLTG
jgi:hypothetical protein